ncbi:MAG: alpha/beta fold hydrolase [Alphaproteobacteria bacterium]|nr:alpha/beta fold hydrolase [Alphaproteobacteria bacterium]
MRTLRHTLCAALFGVTVMQASGSAQAEMTSGLYYETCGSGTETIIFLHDTLLHSAAYDEVWELVCKTGDFAAVRYDRRGYGNSPAATEPYSHTDDLAALISDLDITEAILVASASGTHIAADYGLRRPRLLEGLLLAAPAIGPYAYSTRYIMRNMDLLSPLQDNNVEEALARVSADPYFVSSANTEAHARMVEILKANPQNFGPRPVPSSPSFVYDRLRTLLIPALILVGENDDPDVIDHARVVKRTAPYTQLDIVPNAAHHLYLEQPKVFTDYVLDFADLRMRQ